MACCAARAAPGFSQFYFTPAPAPGDPSHQPPTNTPFIEALYLGFSVVTIEEAWKFTHIHALKRDRKPDSGLKLAF